MDIPGAQALDGFFNELHDINEHFETEFFEQFDDASNRKARAVAFDIITESDELTEAVVRLVMNIASTDDGKLDKRLPESLIEAVAKAFNDEAEKAA